MPKILGNLVKDNWGTGFAYNVFDKHDLAPTIRTFCGGGQQPYIIEENMETKIEAMRGGNLHDSEFDKKIMTFEEKEGVLEKSERHSKNCIQQKYRIRKLTPKECFRLMNFDDEDFYAAESVNSNTRLYSQAGNSIVVGCLAAIFSQLNIKGITPWNKMSLEEKYELTKINKSDDPGYEKNII